MKISILQTPAWEEFEKMEQRKVFRLDEESFSAMAVLEHTLLGNYLFVPYGPTIKNTNDLECRNSFNTALGGLKELAKTQKAFFVRVEPTFNNLDESELRKTFRLRKSHNIDPAHTWVLDLTQSEEKIFADMEKEKGRLWRNAYKKGITIRFTKDPEEIDILMKMLQKVGSANHFIPQKRIHLYNQMKAGFATLYIAELNGLPIAAALAYDHDSTRYYAHAAADYAHRKLATGSIVLVQMIVDAKRSGMKSFDFWGVTTSKDPKHPWYGFTEFKRSFGGRQVDYAGTWDLPIRNGRYFIYKLIRKVNRLRRKIFHLFRAA